MRRCPLAVFLPDWLYESLASFLRQSCICALCSSRAGELALVGEHMSPEIGRSLSINYIILNL